MERFEVRSDTEIVVSRNADVELACEETPTSGYVWTAHAVDPALTVTDVGFEGASRSVGGGGRHVFRVRAAIPGPHTIELRLARAWEPTALRRHLVTFVVK